MPLRTIKKVAGQRRVPDRAASKRAPMRRASTLSQWGNSLGLRIPQDAAERLKLKAGAQVSVEVRGDGMIVRPTRAAKRWTEAELLKGVTPDNAGGEIDWSGPVGKEVW